MTCVPSVPRDLYYSCHLGINTKYSNPATDKWIRGSHLNWISKAFDSVHQSPLAMKFAEFEIAHEIYNWLISYFSNKGYLTRSCITIRSDQRMSTNGACSSSMYSPGVRRSTGLPSIALLEVAKVTSIWQFCSMFHWLGVATLEHRSGVEWSSCCGEWVADISYSIMLRVWLLWQRKRLNDQMIDLLLTLGGRPSDLLYCKRLNRV